MKQKRRPTVAAVLAAISEARGPKSRIRRNTDRHQRSQNSEWIAGRWWHSRSVGRTTEARVATLWTPVQDYSHPPPRIPPRPNITQNKLPPGFPKANYQNEEVKVVFRSKEGLLFSWYEKRPEGESDRLTFPGGMVEDHDRFYTSKGIPNMTETRLQACHRKIGYCESSWSV